MVLNKKRTTNKRYGLQSKSLRNRKRRRTIFLSLAVFALPCLILSGIVFVSNLHALQISTVEVVGAQTIEASSVQSIANSLTTQPFLKVFSRNTIFTYPDEAVLAAVASSSPRIKDVEVEAEGLQVLKITISERLPQAVWCSETSECFNVDDTGLIYESTGIEDKFEKFTFLGYTVDKHVPHVARALEFVHGLESLEFTPISMTITEEEDAEVLLSDGLVLKVSLFDDPIQRLDAVRTLLSDQIFAEKIHEDQLAYIDLRFGNKVYYKVKGDVAEEVETPAPEAEVTPAIEETVSE